MKVVLRFNQRNCRMVGKPGLHSHLNIQIGVDRKYDSNIAPIRKITNRVSDLVHSFPEILSPMACYQYYPPTGESVDQWDNSPNALRLLVNSC
jgi:hypothetical protein